MDESPYKLFRLSFNNIFDHEMLVRFIDTILDKLILFIIKTLRNTTP